MLLKEISKFVTGMIYPMLVFLFPVLEFTEGKGLHTQQRQQSPVMDMNSRTRFLGGTPPHLWYFRLHPSNKVQNFKLGLPHRLGPAAKEPSDVMNPEQHNKGNVPWGSKHENDSKKIPVEIQTK